jgi:iron complex outermembrane receptor protein
VQKIEAGQWSSTFSSHAQPQRSLRSAATVAFALALALTARDARAQDSAASPARAPAADSGERSEIIVTARRREERAQDVPIALTVIGSKQLEVTGNYTLSQVQQQVPSLQIYAINPRNTNINIRGLGSNVAASNDGLENGVGLYIDNVYYARPGQSAFDLIDIDRIEVLRGPQGTLFGKNTTAGAINITTREPSFTPEFTGEGSLGNYNYHQVRASISAPLIGDTVAFRLSVADTHRDGYIDDVRTGQELQGYDNFTVRGQLLIQPTSSLKIRLIGDYSHQHDDCCVGLFDGTFSHYADGTLVTNTIQDRAARAGYTLLALNNPFAFKTDVDAPVYVDMKSYGVSGQVDWDLGHVALTSVTSYRWWDWNPSNDNDATGLSINSLGATATRQRQFSQELRLASTGKNTIDWVVGLYYFWQTIRSTGAGGFGSAAPDWYRAPNSPLPLSVWNAALNGFQTLNHSDPITHSYAGFGQATWHITDRLSLTGGLRFTHEDKTGTFSQGIVGGTDLSTLPAALAAAAQAIRNSFAPVVAYDASRHDNALTGLASLAYKITPDVLAYASYSRGNQSGGLNLTTFPVGVIVPKTVSPEKVNAYEVGLKSQLFDRRLTMNLAGFWTDITNYQSAVTTITNLGSSLQYLQNVGAVRSRGIEADSSFAVTSRISISGNIAYTDAYYVHYQNAPVPVELSDNTSLVSVDLSGQPIPGASKFAYSLGIDASQPVGSLGSQSLELYGHADWGHRSSYLTQVTNSIYSRVPAYGLLTARIGVRTENQRWDVSLWAHNLTDTHYFQTLAAQNTGQIAGTVGEPRTFGGTVRFKY